VTVSNSVLFERQHINHHHHHYTKPVRLCSPMITARALSKNPIWSDTVSRAYAAVPLEVQPYL
jgi:hypothetical protein